MFKELIINEEDHETRVALLEDGTIAEMFIERSDASDIAGNIYKGKVQRVLPGMNAAFVDIGLKQAAFIFVNDVIDDSFSEYETIFDTSMENEDDEEEDDSPFLKTIVKRDSNIENLLCEGKNILVEVSKSPIGTKGARVTSRITLPGRFLVLMPLADHIGVSRRIELIEERERLKNIIMDLRANNFGYIVRTAAEGMDADKLKKEMTFLIHLWETIKTKFNKINAPALLHRELTLTLRSVRDLLTHEVDKLVVDSKEGYDAIMDFLNMIMPEYKNSVELYEGNEPIFDHYNLEVDLSRALRKKVWLKSGGYIIIEHTEALTAIDVNTGRYVGKHNLEETILKTNLEAVKEIAYQIRLRDIGGIIIIDFIDMEKKSNQEKVYNALKDILKRDKSKTNVLPISEMGLIQMTRKRIRKPLNRILCEPCFYCEGEGYLLSGRTICNNIYREIIREDQNMQGKRISLFVNPQIADMLHGEENHIISSIEKRINKHIEIYPKNNFHLEEFEIYEIAGEK